MKISLVGINARYTHSNLAVKYLYEEVKDLAECEIFDFTINDQKEAIINKLVAGNFDYICFSTYIWNSEMVKELVGDLKTINNEIKIILGGPEVSFDSEKFLLDSGADYLIVGEGESVLKDLLENLIKGSSKELVSVLSNENGKISGDSTYAVAKNIPCIYMDNKYIEENKYVYYEASRGCPYNCAFCLSSCNQGLRFKDIDLVKMELKTFLEARVDIVKFIDRSFNYNPNQKEIVKFLKDNDNGHTTFHLELHPSLIDDEFIDMINSSRGDLFQFEIGLQTTNEETAREIQRAGKFDDIKDVCKKLVESKAHIHMDLIVGLPYEDVRSFKKSFNDLYSIRPEKIQMGFLKLLKGSKLRDNKDKYNYKFFRNAPYEVISNNWLTYSDIIQLKGIENIVDRYYNEGYFTQTVNYIIESHYPSPWEFFEDMAKYWIEKDILYMSLSRIDIYNILAEFIKKNWDEDYMYELLIFDYYKNGNNRSVKFILNDYHERYDNKSLVDLIKKNDAYITSLSLDPNSLLKKSNIEVFNIDDFLRTSEEYYYHFFVKEDGQIIHFAIGGNEC